MNFLSLTQTAQNQFPAFPHQKAANVLSVILILLLAYKAAAFTWSLIPQPAQQQNSPMPEKAATAQSANNQASSDISKVTQLHLFGEANKKEPPKPKQPVVQPSDEIVDSAIKLDIRGIIAASEPERSSIILKNKGKDEIFVIGDKLPGGNYILEQIESRRVIIRRNGKLEAVNFDDVEYSSIKVNDKTVSDNAPNSSIDNNNAANTEVIDKREDKQLARTLGAYREQLLNDPMGMMNSGELLRASPVFRNGQLKGFRLRPGRNRDAFKQSGLRRNDIVTSINGTTLTDPSAAMALIGTIGSASQLSLTVERGSKQIDVILGLSNE